MRSQRHPPPATTTTTPGLADVGTAHTSPNRSRHSHHDDTGQQPIHLLYCRMSRGDINEFLTVAIWPIITTQTTVGEPNRSASDNDADQRDQRKIR